MGPRDTGRSCCSKDTASLSYGKGEKAEYVGSRRWLWANRGWEPGHLLRTEECGVEE